MTLNRPEVMLDILEEHLQELDFLCEQRAAVAFDPDWDLVDLSQLERRIESHIDGLVVGLGHSVELALGALSSDTPSLAAAATLVLLRIGGEASSLLSGALPTLLIGSLLGVRQASRLGSIETLRPTLERFAIDGPTAALRAVAADILAFHGVELKGIELQALLHDESPEVRRVAIAASARLGFAIGRETLLIALDSEESEARRDALRSAAESRSTGLLEVCRSHPCAEALSFVGVIGSVADVALLESELADPSRAISALEALGALGLPAAVPLILRALRVPDLAEAAGRAFKRVTGVDLASSDASRAPEVDAAERFWSTEERRYRASPRWQAGQSVEPTALAKVFDELPLAIRRDLYLGRRFADPNAKRLELERAALLQLSRERTSQLR